MSTPPPGPSGGRTLVSKPQASGECERTSSLGIRAGVLGCGQSSVRFQGQENAQREMRGARRKDSALPLCPSRPPPCLQRGNSLPVPEGSKSAATSSRAHDGAGGPGAPKPCAQATRGQAAMTRGSRNIRGQIPFFLHRSLLRISRSWWMRRQKNGGGGGSLSLEEQRMKNESLPSSHPFPD